VLEPVALSLGDWDKITVPEAIGVSPWAVIATLAVGIALLLWLIKRTPPTSEPLPG
jgi:hypothetical protein